MRQMPAVAGRQEREAGEARPGSCLDEAEPPPRAPNDTGAGLLSAVLARENLDTSGNLLLRGAHGPIGFGFDIAVGLKGLFPLRPWPFEGGFAPVPPSWGHVEAILSSQHHRFML